MYPYVIDITGHHELHQEVPTYKLNIQQISNGIISFLENVKGCTVNDKHGIYCVILYLFGAAVYWPDKTQPASDTHSTALCQWCGLVSVCVCVVLSSTCNEYYDT